MLKARSKTNVPSLFDLSAPKSSSVTGVDLDWIRRSAETGDAESQSKLADYYYTGTHGCTTNMVESYKWANLAAAQGKKPAGDLLRVLELFMTAEEVDTAKARAKAFTKNRTESSR